MTGVDSTSPTAPRAYRVADPARLRECVHCGLCLTACPTYLELGTEMDSPRGRLYLMKGLEEGTLEPSPDVVRHLDLCLGCRACESACPSGVRYGEVLEQTRTYLARRAPRPLRERLRRAAVLRVFPHAWRVRALLGAADLARTVGLWDAVARRLEAAQLVPPTRTEGSLAAFHPAQGRERARVGLLRGCVGGELFAGVNAAAVRVLTRSGVSVVVPPEQGCCGALHLHSGEADAARAFVRQNLHAFPGNLDAIVVTAAGCGAAMKEYDRLLAGEAERALAARFAERVRDVTEVLDALQAPLPLQPLPMRVTYHDACHLAHAQGVRQAPRRLLERIPALELVELAESDVCCGSAGSYNLTEPAMARRLRERKIDHLVATGADCVAVANPGCALQIQAGLAARGTPMRVAHPVELLAEALP